MDASSSVEDLLKALSFGIDHDKSIEENSAQNDGESTGPQEQQHDVLPEHVVDLIPDWVDFEEEERQEDAGEDCDTASVRLPASRSPSHSSPLELLGSDVASSILVQLTLTEICATSLVSRALYHFCRSEELWRIKFKARWNTDWISTDFQAYQAAYANTHDLWMTHWNIVKPEDGDAPGRCCVDDVSSQQAKGDQCCPICRYSNLVEVIKEACYYDVNQAEIEAAARALAANEKKSSRAKVIQASTRYSIAKWLHNTQHLPPVPMTRSPARAFASASTFHRRINTRQYQAKSLQFMTDAVFLNVCDSFLKQGTDQECEQVRKEVYGKMEEDVTAPGAVNTVAHLGSSFELTQHTWHIVRFSNPDYVRPLTFRIFVQRPDCFTVYPSEGYLDPGESRFIFLGVRLLGGLMSQAMEALNVQREGVDPLFADIYAHEAHLPYAPFCIRYMFCAVTPCIPPLFSSRGGMKTTRPEVASTSKYKNVVSYLWEHVATEAGVRTQYISAHVNANYSYNEFCQDVLFPLDIQTSNHWKDAPKNLPLVHIAPNLIHRFPSIFERLQNLQLEMQLSDAGKAYRTERECTSCKRDWGPRAEELGRRHILQMLTSIAEQHKQSLQMRNFVLVLRIVYTIIERDDDDEDWDEVYRLMFVLHGVLMSSRAQKRITKDQREVLIQFEVVVDHLCQVVQVKRGFQDAALEDGPMTWRHVGVYRHLLSTDSVFEPTAIVGDLLKSKEEPEYLDGFRHLCHNPGTYCLGQQQDPNHEDRKIPVSDVRSSSLKRAFRSRQREKASDIFMDDTTLSFASALAMIHDPRSLIVHGIYDRVFSPGTIARRPSLPSPYFARTARRPRDLVSMAANAQQKLKSWKPLSEREVREFPVDVAVCKADRYSLRYNDVDPDGNELTLFTAEGSPIQQKSLFDDFVRNVPSPGMGRFALSEIDESADRNDDRIIELSLVSGGSQTQVATAAAVNSNPIDVDADPIEVANHQERLNPLLLGPRGPRLFNLFWLLSSHLGWSIQESHGGSPVMVERRVLIASQWVANSAMAMPVLYTLMARAVEWISPKPIDYHLEGIPYDIGSEMRFFSPRECAFAACAVFLLWLMMGRYSERKIGRTFERSMMEHLSSDQETRFLRRVFLNPFSIWMQQCWDRLCPIFLQRLVFTPCWNRRTHAEITDHIRLWRSKDLREHRSSFPSSAGRGVMTFGASVEDGGPPVSIWEESSSSKFLTGILVALGSFSACSPHFTLNALTVFCCSIGLGMSVSLQSMETGRGIPSSSSNPPGRSIFRPFGLNTVVIAFFLIGQLVGSSGGVLFLAEFVVTSVSLVLGGAGTVSASAMESWGCFFCLSTTAFWGYIFARVALMDGTRNKKRGASGVFLCASLVAISLLWMLTLLVWQWDVPPTAMLIRDSLSKRSDRKQIAQQLQ
jgi:hypothetical protein